MKVYKLKTLLLVRLWAAGLVMGGMSATLLFFEIFGNKPLPSSDSMLWGPAGMLAVSIFVMISVSRQKIEIDDKKIVLTDTFSKKVLYFNEIRGYRYFDVYFFIESLDKSNKAIHFKIDEFEKNKEISAWLFNNYVNLNTEDVKKEEEAILNSEELGRSQEERAQKLNRQRQIASGLNIAGVLTCVWGWVWPEPYEYSLIVCLLIPLAAIFATKLSGGLIKINPGTASAYPSPVLALMLPSLVVSSRTWLDFEILDFSPIWLPAGLMTLLFMVLLLLGNKEFTYREKKDFLIVSVIAVNGFLYSYGFLMTANCCYDESLSEIHYANIINKRENSGKLETYYFELKPWLPPLAQKEVMVSEDLYDMLKVNDEVSVIVKKGNLGISWFFVLPKTGKE